MTSKPVRLDGHSLVTALLPQWALTSVGRQVETESAEDAPGPRVRQGGAAEARLPRETSTATAQALEGNGWVQLPTQKVDPGPGASSSSSGEPRPQPQGSGL